MTAKRSLTRADIMPLADYVKERAERRKRMAATKRSRRVEVGPFATFYFENHATMWHQIHEMLYIENFSEPFSGQVWKSCGQFPAEGTALEEEITRIVANRN